jgi:hypothetical protein
MREDDTRPTNGSIGKHTISPGPTRREFLATGAVAAVGLAGTRFAIADSVPPNPEQFVAKIDRKRIVDAAGRYLREQPVTVTSASSPRSSGGPHDYFSEGDYWWPDPKNPGGPYIQRDGYSNPDNFNAHRLALIRMSIQVPALAAAWVLTHERRYSEHALAHLRAWFVDERTKMNPNLQYAQAIHGRFTGRGTGIIDTVHLAEVVRAAAVLAHGGAIQGADDKPLRQWFADYLDWMNTSENGKQERDARNNHGTCWLVQAGEFARYTGNEKRLAEYRERFKTVLAPHQIADNGSFPEELRRTKPYGYCLFNLDAMAMVCQILSTPDENLFTWTLPDGRGYAKAIAYMYPFVADKSKWPMKPDVEYFQYWPVRQPSLLFAGLALKKPDYIDLWRKLDPDPTVPEIIRNFPYRQPLLWLVPLS